jgi:hypothetical protein
VPKREIFRPNKSFIIKTLCLLDFYGSKNVVWIKFFIKIDKICYFSMR